MMFSKTFLAAALAAVGATAQNMTSSNMTLTGLISSNPQLSQLNQLINLYPSIGRQLASMKNITLLAPNNAAISVLRRGLGARQLQDQTLVQSLLDYHVLQGEYYASQITPVPQFIHSELNNTMYSNVTGGQVVECVLRDNTTVEFISGLKFVSNVTMANQNFTGGVVHVIDEVLTVPYNVSTTAIAANLTSFVGAINAAGLQSTINSLSDVTIFAPSNTAFQAIGNIVSNASTKTLTSVLEYHVLNGTVAYSTLLGNGSVATLGGGNLTITVEDGAVFVNGARVINSDLLVSGGVMHVIDSVLNPMGNRMEDAVPTGTTAVLAFPSATTASSIPLTSGVSTTATVRSVLVSTVTDVVSGFPTQTGGAVNTQGGSSSGMAPAATGMMGAAALFGAGAMVANW